MTTPTRTFGLTHAVATLAFAGWISSFVTTASASPAHDEANSTTVIGSNALLSDGASALEAGHLEEGLRLTLAGLGSPASLRDVAAGHANACAGYIMLKQLEEALAQCNESIEMDSGNWRAYNNRAAIYVAKGLYDLAIRDIQSGLALAPGSHTLLESMRVAQRNKRITESRGGRSLPS